MKKIIISLLLMAAPVALFAQLKVFSGGNVSLKTSASDSYTKEGAFVLSHDKEITDWRMLVPKDATIKKFLLDENTLSAMSTSDLLDLCLNCPYLPEISFNCDLNTGLKVLMSKFNGFDELINRKDLVNTIINKGSDIPVMFRNMNKVSDVEKGLFSFKNLLLELLLLQKGNIANLDIKQKEELRNTFELISSIYNDNPDIFGAIHKLSLSAINSEIEKGGYVGGLRYYYPVYSPVTIYTPNNSVVPNAEILSGSDCSYTPAENAAIASHISSVYGGQVIEANTWKYNNAGWTWHTSETNYKVNIFYGSDSVYRSDGSYIQVPAGYATKVIYGNNNMFSATIESSTKYVSKWGDGGPLVRHHPDSIPNGSDAFFDNVNWYSNTRTYYMRSPNCSIAGSSLICSTESFTIQNLPSGATVQWSASNSKLSLVSGQGTGTATFQKVSNGACTITAQVTLGTTTVSFTKDVWAGTPTAPTVTGWPHTNLFMENTEYDFVAHGNSQAQILEYQWTVIKGATLISGGSSSSASFMMNSPGPVSIKVRARNACGWGPYTNKSGGITDDKGLIPINSPGNNIVSIPLSGDGEYEIQLWNTNRMIRSTKTTKSSYDVDLSNLPSDLYIIKVLKDGQNFNQMKVKK